MRSDFRSASSRLAARASNLAISLVLFSTSICTKNISRRRATNARADSLRTVVPRRSRVGATTAIVPVPVVIESPWRVLLCENDSSSTTRVPSTTPRASRVLPVVTPRALPAHVARVTVTIEPANHARALARLFIFSRAVATLGTEKTVPRGTPTK